MKRLLRFILLAGIIAVILFPAYILAYDNLPSSKQPGGFRGVYWESSKFNHTDLFSMFDNIDGVEIFNRELESFTWGAARLSEVRYHFYQDEFYQASIMFDGYKDFQHLLDLLSETYGTPVADAGIHIWENRIVSIRLSPAGATISYLPILGRINP